MMPCSRGCHSSQWSLCYCIYPLIRPVAARPCVRLESSLWHALAQPVGTATLQMSGGGSQSSLCLRALDVTYVSLQKSNSKHAFRSPFVFSEDGCLPYSKPSFPSPGGHSSSGTASSKGSTGPRKTEGPRQPQQWTVTEHADFLGTNGQGQYSGELCE